MKSTSRSLSLTLVLFSSSLLSMTSLAQSACETGSDLSCRAWPGQAQMIGTVTAVAPLSLSGQSLCEVTVTPSSWQEHILCPMSETGSTVSYQLCGACPAVGSEVSGVLMQSADGLVVLDR
jgi:hypothetical protein